MNPDIARRLERCSNLPSLPTAATRIVDLARDPQASMRDVADAVLMDPALSAKLLRMANSPLYARRKPCESFQQALVLLGLNATLTLALTFTLAGSMRGAAGSGLDYAWLWRRALLSATAARAMGVHFGLKDVEELFLSGLMQDLGLLALDVTFPGLYQDVSTDERGHECLLERERSQLETDHAQVGHWLLSRWNLPERLVEAVAASHTLDTIQEPSEEQRFQQAVALSGTIADVWMGAQSNETLMEMRERAFKVSGLGVDAVMGVLESIAQEAPEIEELFEMELLEQQRAEWVLQEAREVLMFRNLQMVQESAQLRQQASELKAQTQELEERSKRDNLTGAFNRGYLDATLEQWFADANQHLAPLSVVFVDLDDFKRVNDRHGHQIGDEVLRRYGEMLRQVVRDTDIVARYGGEEFVLLLRNCGAAGASSFCERLVQHCRQVTAKVRNAEVLHVTASMGLATHGEGVKFATTAQLVRAADDALYKAKQSGKNRFVTYTLRADAA